MKIIISHHKWFCNDGINKVVNHPSFQKLDVANLIICHSDYFLKDLIAFYTQSVRKLAAWRPWLQVKILMFLHKYFHLICVSVAMTPLIRLSTILHFKNWMWPLGCHRNRAKGEHCCCLRLTYLKVMIDYQVGHINFSNHKHETFCSKI